MKNFKAFASVSALLAALVSPAAMATPVPAGPTFSSVGGHSTHLGNDFDPAWVAGFSAAGFNLHNMQKSGELVLSSAASLSFSFVGKEANYNNGFYFGNSDGAVINSTTNSAGAYTFDAGSKIGGALDFWFKSNNLGGAIHNGADALGLILSHDKKSALVLFNDNYRGDKDYDDMIIKISITTPVSEPETYALMLGGLALLGAVARRRKNRV
ncbi:PEP-CTERM sorting domain-containing protein [Rhodoferax saidenbachensis]|uniref:Ice-binding protein C-terminal domain-containing protein n=1 Tax=Rhodoferax saidenbachensis TaxID=1484693 RepID=A0ABU1ZN05_9BURK|nr:PEP-CTERM sorting domain-containing protein [Rhodoferax saidenbachensis]MDR7306922.1 hypothetical protein [Rhodoferax saidenbachensis]